MFKNLFGSNGSNSKTGFFKVANEHLIGIDEIQGNGSINSYIESLGFATNHIRTVHTFNSDKIACLGFKSLSKKVVLVLAKNQDITLSYSDVQKEVNQIDWDFEYSSLNIEDILEEGIEMGNFDFEFLKSVIDLTEDGEDIFKSEQLGIYLQFENGIFKAFTSTGWDNAATKWLTGLNPIMVRKMKEEAMLYQQNDIDTIDEVNKQAKSILEVPYAIKNEFIPLHTNSNGNINFYNLLITHYSKECTIGDFLFMNRGRFTWHNANTIEVGNYVYSFSENGELESCIRH